MCELTNTVFTLKKKIEFVYEKDQFSVKAIRKIRKNEVLIIEHVLHAEENNYDMMINEVARCKDLFNTLYPRNMQWSVEKVNNIDFNEMCKKKVFKNAFVKDDIWMLCFDVSKFNHSDNFNCTTVASSNTYGGDTLVCCISVAAIRDIEEGEEITIYYSGDYLGTKGQIILKTDQETIDFIANKLEKYLPTKTCTDLVNLQIKMQVSLPPKIQLL